MRSAVEARQRFGEGPLSRAVALIYSLLAVELLLVATTVPGLLALIALDRDASNLPLFAACALPVGPAGSAAVYALYHHRGDLTDLKPAAAFWRGYRANLRGVALVWVPFLVWLTVIGVNLANLGTAGVPRWWAPVLVVVAVAVTLCGVNALVITSLFAFRVRDVARLAAYFLGKTPGVTLGNACLLLVAAAVTAVFSEAVLVLLGSVFVLSLVRTCRPMIDKVRQDFTA